MVCSVFLSRIRAADIRAIGFKSSVGKFDGVTVKYALEHLVLGDVRKKF